MPAVVSSQPPQAGHSHAHPHQHSHSCTPADLAFLANLTSSHFGVPTQKPKGGDRRPQLDPLIIETASASGPHVTRNHYLHEFYPHESYPHLNLYSSADLDPQEISRTGQTRIKLESRQAPRHVRLAREAEKDGKPYPSGEEEKEEKKLDVPGQLSGVEQEPERVAGPSSERLGLRRHSATDHAALSKLLKATAAPPAFNPASDATFSATSVEAQPLAVSCYVRTRIPTPHGDVFLHLYKNNHDTKEHLAFVIDKHQLQHSHTVPDSPYFIRSKSLDERWRPDETETERIVRGAYVGRLTAGHAHPAPLSPPTSNGSGSRDEPPPPLVRIHSECFTGETIGSQRCDCGEQLDEAFRLISECPSGRGVIVYLRQEGRGIGLLEKMRAYNLQDLGHDTVTANLLLGHGADLRHYDIAGAILRDLDIEQVRLMTNNPDKIEQVEREGISVSERIGMVPRSWRCGERPRRRRMQRKHAGAKGEPVDTEESSGEEEFQADVAQYLRRSGVGMIGAGNTESSELNKYLRTKIERMGHMLELPTPSTHPGTPSTADNSRPPSRGRAVRPQAMSRIASQEGNLQAEGVDLAMSTGSLWSDGKSNPDSLDCGEDCGCKEAGGDADGERDWDDGKEA